MITANVNSAKAADAAAAAARAWIVYDHVDTYVRPEGSYYYLTLKNVGKTPAIRVHTTWELKESEAAPKFDRCPESNPGNFPYVAADEPFKIGVPPRRIPATLWIHGGVQYRDALSRERRLTEFCQNVQLAVLCPTNNELR